MSLIILNETEEDHRTQEEIRSRANYSIAVLEKAFIRNGSGRYLVLRENPVLVYPELAFAQSGRGGHPGTE